DIAVWVRDILARSIDVMRTENRKERLAVIIVEGADMVLASEFGHTIWIHRRGVIPLIERSFASSVTINCDGRRENEMLNAATIGSREHIGCTQEVVLIVKDRNM